MPVQLYTQRWKGDTGNTMSKLTQEPCAKARNRVRGQDSGREDVAGATSASGCRGHSADLAKHSSRSSAGLLSALRAPRGWRGLSLTGRRARIPREAGGDCVASGFAHAQCFTNAPVTLTRGPGSCSLFTQGSLGEQR